MGFMTAESMAYDKYKREHAGESHEDAMLRIDTEMWRIEKPNPCSFRNREEYEAALDHWYTKRPTK